MSARNGLNAENAEKTERTRRSDLMFSTTSRSFSTPSALKGLSVFR
jgi:hypothetical protein